VGVKAKPFHQRLDPCRPNIDSVYSRLPKNLISRVFPRRNVPELQRLVATVPRKKLTPENDGKTKRHACLVLINT